MSIQELANPNVAKSLGLTSLDYWPAGVKTFVTGDWTPETIGGAFFAKATIKNISSLLTANSVVTATMGGIPTAEYQTYWLVSANPSIADGGTINIYVAATAASGAGSKPTGTVYVDYAVHKF